MKKDLWFVWRQTNITKALAKLHEAQVMIKEIYAERAKNQRILLVGNIGAMMMEATYMKFQAQKKKEKR